MMVVFSGLLLVMLLAALDSTMLGLIVRMASGDGGAPRRARLAELLADWEPERREELAAVLGQLSRELVPDASRP